MMKFLGMKDQLMRRHLTYLFSLHTLQGRINVVPHSHVDESVLSLRLHHARPLGPHHQRHLLYVYLTVQTCRHEALFYMLLSDIGIQYCCFACSACLMQNVSFKFIQAQLSSSMEDEIDLETDILFLTFRSFNFCTFCVTIGVNLCFSL